MSESKAWYVARRGELLAEQFLLELGAMYVSALHGPDIGIDYIAFFAKKDALWAVAVQVKATERELNGRFQMMGSSLSPIRNSNIPVLLVVADVKRNDIYFNWVRQAAARARGTTMHRVSVDVRKATSEEKERLRREILEDNGDPTSHCS